MSPYQAAVDLARKKIPTFACSASKSPLVSKEDGGKGFHDATLDHTPEQWEKAALVGMPTGTISGFDIVDIDVQHNGDEWLADNIMRLPVTRTVRTRSGGYHLYFKAREDMRCSVSRIANGVDVRSQSGYVIRWDAAGYAVEDADIVADWPQWLADAAQTSRVRHADNPNRTSADVEAPSVAAVVELLDAMPNPDDTDRDMYLRVMMAARGCGDDPEIGEAAVRWADRWCDSRGEEYEAEKWQRDFSLRDRPLAGWSNLLAAATRFGVDVARFRALTPSEFGALAPTGYHDAVAETRRVLERSAGAGELMGNPNWASMLLTNDKDAPRASIANALHAFQHSPAWAGVLAHDEFSSRDMLIAPPPWHIGVFAPREVEDTDHTYAAEWLHVRGINVSTACVAEAMHAVAKRSPFHPVRSYLHGLVWDGTPRIETWLHEHLGAADTPLNRAFGSKFLISAVARIMKPGCQVDTMLVLEGEQGIRKSTALRLLAGAAWFTDHIPDLHNKDSAAQLLGIWLMEHAELATLGRADANKAKEFISRRVDRFRPSYGRVAIDHPRQCVFAATMNPNGRGYLKDETGARRFWTVLCGVDWLAGRQVDTAKLAAVRDQLWAEAAECLAAGVPWWLDDRRLEREQAEVASHRYTEDAWAAGVREYLAPRESTSVDEICAEHLKLDAAFRNDISQRRIQSMLRHFGWVSKQKRVPGVKKKPYRYWRPASWGPVESVADSSDMDALAA